MRVKSALPQCLTLMVALAGAVACSKPPLVRAVKAARAHVEATVTTTTSGTVAADQEAALGFGTSGRVRSVLATEGDRVTRGQVLAELENTDLKTIFEDAGRELKRARSLYRAKLVSRAAFDEANKAYEIARANLDKTLIKAPFDGVVTEVNLEVGELTQGASGARDPLIQLIDLKPRLVKGDIDEADLARVREGQPARVKVPAAGSEPFRAVVHKVVPYVSTEKEQDRTSRIELRITDGEAAAIPVGASADIEIITDQRRDVLAVPTRAVLGYGDQRYVFREVEGRVSRTSIKNGIGNYARTEIVSGLTKDDVVLYPPDELELKDGMKVKVELAPWP